MRDVREDDSDLDALIGRTLVKVGPSPAVLEKAARLQAMIDAAYAEPAPLIDPRTLPVRFSRLKEMGRSPAHYLHACQEDDVLHAQRETFAMRFGAGVHGMLLGEIGVDVVLYGGHRAGNAWVKYQDENKGATILNPREWRECAAVCRAVRKNKLAERLIFDGTVREKTIHWQIGSRAARSTPDVRAPKYIVDLKSTRCSDLRWFSREAVNRHYHAQLPFYDEAGVAVGEQQADELYIVAVESAEPHPVTVFTIPDELRDLGARTWNLWFERLRVCEESQQWPEYAQGLVELEAPFQIGDGADE